MKPFKVASKVKLVGLEYELSQEAGPSADLLSNEILVKYPTSLGDFSGKQASDGSYMHVAADAKLVDS